MFSATVAVCPNGLLFSGHHQTPFTYIVEEEMGQMAASDGWDRQAQSFREIRTRRLSGERWATENRLVVVRDSGSLSEATYSWSPSVGTTQSNFNKKKKEKNAREAKKKTSENLRREARSDELAGQY